MAEPKTIILGRRSSCGNCMWFRRGKVGQPMGVCRQSPPTVVLIGMAQDPVTQRQVPVTDTFWPQVPDTELCGQHQARPVVDIDLTKLDAELIEGSA